jgi:hypothetical protein
MVRFEKKKALFLRIKEKSPVSTKQAVQNQTATLGNNICHPSTDIKRMMFKQNL